MMKTDKYIKIGYRSIDDGMVRVVTFPSRFSVTLFDDKTYCISTLRGSDTIESFGQHSRICRDEYGQYWYHKVTKVGDMESFETFEPLPEYIVSAEYEEKRIPGMMIFPYIRVDHARGIAEVFEKHVGLRDEEAFKRNFLKNNELNIEQSITA